jgi:imidazolonepropionase-like amidohydrolase
MKPLLLAIVCAWMLHAEDPGVFAIRNARVVPVKGPALEHATVVVRKGLIEAVGANVTPPADAWIIEGEGLTVYPGLIDALSTVGLAEAPARPITGAGAGGATTPTAATPATPAAPPARGPEDRPSTTSWLRAADVVKPADRSIESARASGFTTAVTFPHQGIFAGQGAVIDLAGENVGQMVVSAPAGQYVALTTGGFGGGYPASLMGAIAYVRQLYLDADYYRHAKEFYAAHPRGTTRPAYDRALEGVLESPRVLLPAGSRREVDRMLRFSQELKLPVILYGLTEGYRSADLLANGNAPVLVNLKWPEKSPDADPDEPDALRILEVRENAPSTPAALAKKGVRFALYSGGIDRRADFVRALRRALDAGLSADDALRAMTLAPAEIYGVADRLGSIEPGKIANLVVTKGDLFDEKGQVKYVFVDGIKFEPVEEAPTPRPGTRDAAPGSEQQ